MTQAVVPVGEDVIETWEITTPGRVWVQTTTRNRYGQPELKDVSVGPNRPGQKLKISTADRIMNQEACAKPELDPFRNGLLVRTDVDQQADPDTASDNALTAPQLLDIFSKQGEAFRDAIKPLNEIPLRRLFEMAEAVDATVAQMKVLGEVIEERYDSRKSQGDKIYGLDGELHKAGADGARVGTSAN